VSTRLDMLSTTRLVPDGRIVTWDIGIPSMLDADEVLDVLTGTVAVDHDGPILINK